MTALSATSANELTATFAAAVASEGAVTIKVNKAGSTTAITGTTKWSEDLTSVVFTAAAKLTAGTYEMTATDAADTTKTTSKTVVVENEKVTSIVVTNDVALTSANKKTAYAYYDVFNQYNESIRSSTTINWTASCGTATVNKATGKISMPKADGTDHVYGSSIYLTGVYTKTGVNIQKEMKVGMEQNLDTIKTYGFVKDTDKSTILDKLPTNFQKNQYVMVFKAFDQNENEYDVNDINFATDVTFISDAPLLVTSDFTNGGVMTIKGEEYYAVKVQPGQYVDKGGEVNITAISNKTGNKTVQNYVIGANAMIASLALSQPTVVVADGEKDVKIPYIAKDTDGNIITNYETIARATNEISLTASEGTLVVKEENDGTAGVYWTDVNTYDYDNASASNEVDRTVALTTVVIGGESNNLLLQVSDMARPVAVKSVKLGTDISTAVVELNTDSLSITGDSFTFVDQYGRTMDDSIKVRYNADAGVTDLKTLAKKFFTLSSFGTGSNECYYAVKLEKNSTATTNFDFAPATTAKGGILIGDSGQSGVNASVTWDVPEGEAKARTETFKYTVAAIKKADATANADDWDDCAKKYSVNYDVVPVTLVTSISIKDLNKQYISLGLEDNETGSIVGFNDADMKLEITTTGAISSGDLTVTVPNTSPISGNNYEQTVKLAGAYKGVSVVVPNDYASFESDKFDMQGAATINTAAVTSGCSLTVGDFYNAKDAKFNRKDGSFKVTARVYSTSNSAIWANAVSGPAAQLAAPTKSVAVSDAAPAPEKIVAVDFTINPTNVAHTLNMSTLYGFKSSDNKTADKWYALDQYGLKFTTANLTSKTGTVTNVVENAKEFAHLDNSFAVSGNATDKIELKEVEILDTFDLVIYAANKYGSASATVKVTVGADTNANVSNTGNADKNLRKDYLHYAY